VPASRRIGLARALSKLGYCSRSQATTLIRAGSVQLNGSVSRNPEAPVHLEKDRISIEGVKVDASKKIYLMMNKPRGLVTTASDEKRRGTVYDVLTKSGESLPWVAPVGRLDKASEGLLLLTNDSDWGARIAAPETHLEKTYHVQIDRLADDALMRAMRSGITSDGDRLHARSVRILRTGEKNCWLEITLDEGKNRHIRRMMEALEAEVLRLVRVAIGPLQLGDLDKGAFRPLTPEEKRSLDQGIGRRPATAAKRRQNAAHGASRG